MVWVDRSIIVVDLVFAQVLHVVVIISVTIVNGHLIILANMLIILAVWDGEVFVMEEEVHQDFVEMEITHAPRPQEYQLDMVPVPTEYVILPQLLNMPSPATVIVVIMLVSVVIAHFVHR